MHTLFINACVRQESRTLRLANHALQLLGGPVTRLDLQTDCPPPLDRTLLAQRDALLADGDLQHPMLRYARQFAEAERIVIAAPFWDLGFPALLKAYLENITVSGVTFRYEQGHPVSLCSARELIYVTTAGGPIFADFGYPYVQALAEGFFGIGSCRCFRAQLLDVIGMDTEAILLQAEQEITAALEQRETV